MNCILLLIVWKKFEGVENEMGNYHLSTRIYGQARNSVRQSTKKKDIVYVALFLMTFSA